MADFDDDYDAAAAEVAAAQRSGAVDDDDDMVLQAADKPGFAAWRDALTTRLESNDKRSSWGRWVPEEQAVQLTRQRGKKMQVMGHTRHGERFLSAIEALFLLDDGALLLQSDDVPMQTDAEPHASAAAADPSADAAEAAAAVDAEGDDAAEDNNDADDDFSAFLSFESAYSLLLAHTNLQTYLVYCYLRGLGMVALMHVETAAMRRDRTHLVAEVVETAASAAVSANSNLTAAAWPREASMVQRDEEPIQVAFDVYTRDGISSFRPSAPGPPDFYIVLTGPDAPPPSPTQLDNLQYRLRRHMATLAQVQHARTASGVTATATAHLHADLAAREPVVKFAIVQHTAIAFYGVTESVLRLP